MDILFDFILIVGLAVILLLGALEAFWPINDKPTTTFHKIVVAIITGFCMAGWCLVWG